MILGKNVFFVFSLALMLSFNTWSWINSVRAGEESKDVGSLKGEAGAQNKALGVPKIKISLEKESAKIGDQVVLNIEIELPDKKDLKAGPEFKGLEKLVLISQRKVQKGIRVTFLVDKIEDFTVGPVVMTFVDSGGQENVIQSNELELKVISQIGKDVEGARLKPVRDIIPIKPLWLKILPWMLFSLLVVLILVGSYLLIKKARNKKRAQGFKLAPHTEAIKELDKLKKKRLFEKGKYKEHYFGISEIVRKYMEAIRDIPARELTTEEIKRRAVLEEDMKLLSLLKTADLVKFASFVPTAVTDKENMDKAYQYIENTKPRETEETQG